MIDQFIVFVACVGFAWFNVRWMNTIHNPWLKYIPQVLQYVSVGAAVWVLVGMLGV